MTFWTGVRILSQAFNRWLGGVVVRGYEWLDAKVESWDTDDEKD